MVKKWLKRLSTSAEEKDIFEIKKIARIQGEGGVDGGKKSKGLTEATGAGSRTNKINIAQGLCDKIIPICKSLG